ncbi:LAETG motif-containing sortase-dependent surface protein [Streptomyces sp. NPDC050433]|uniref:LAETG motif-containing sortase-dependent surface protein n=1 Tax=Streptomyces sp. NPDC050433 TaxID=3365615 RepID=UPI00378EE788
MKLRRAVAVAAATAVIAPAAFLAAPAAYAADGDTDTTGTTQTTPEDENPPPPVDDEVVPPPTDDEVDPPVDDDEVVPPPVDDEVVSPPADDEVKPPPADEEAEEAPPADDEEATGPGEDDGEEEEEEPTPPDEECADADFTTTLSGLPSKVVAGSGWKKFNLDLDNTNGKKAVGVDLGAVVLYKKDAHDSFESDLTSKYAQFEYFDGTGWDNTLSDGGSIVGSLNVDAGETYSLQLRLKLAAKAPAGSAVAIAFGGYMEEDENGVRCYLDEKWYSFEVLAADSNPGQVPPAKPEDGKSPADVKPQGGAKPLPAAANGNLAETGANSMLPTIGMAAGIAIVAGGGVVFALRRRGGDAVA